MSEKHHLSALQMGKTVNGGQQFDGSPFQARRLSGAKDIKMQMTMTKFSSRSPTKTHRSKKLNLVDMHTMLRSISSQGLSKRNVKKAERIKGILDELRGPYDLAGTIDSKSKTKRTGDGGVDQINDEIRDGADFSSNGSGKKSHIMEKSIDDSLKDAIHKFSKEETPGGDKPVKIKNLKPSKEKTSAKKSSNRYGSKPGESRYAEVPEDAKQEPRPNSSRSETRSKSALQKEKTKAKKMKLQLQDALKDKVTKKKKEKAQRRRSSSGSAESEVKKKKSSKRKGSTSSKQGTTGNKLAAKLNEEIVKKMESAKKKNKEKKAESVSSNASSAPKKKGASKKTDKEKKQKDKSKTKDKTKEKEKTSKKDKKVRSPSSEHQSSVKKNRKESTTKKVKTQPQSISSESQRSETKKEKKRKETTKKVKKSQSEESQGEPIWATKKKKEDLKVKKDKNKEVDKLKASSKKKNLEISSEDSDNYDQKAKISKGQKEKQKEKQSLKKDKLSSKTSEKKNRLQRDQSSEEEQENQSKSKGLKLRTSTKWQEAKEKVLDKKDKKQKSKKSDKKLKESSDVDFERTQSDRKINKEDREQAKQLDQLEEDANILRDQTQDDADQAQTADDRIDDKSQANTNKQRSTRTQDIEDVQQKHLIDNLLKNRDYKLAKDMGARLSHILSQGDIRDRSFLKLQMMKSILLSHGQDSGDDDEPRVPFIAESRTGTIKSFHAAAKSRANGTPPENVANEHQQLTRRSQTLAIKLDQTLEQADQGEMVKEALQPFLAPEGVNINEQILQDDSHQVNSLEGDQQLQNVEQQARPSSVQANTNLRDSKILDGQQADRGLLQEGLENLEKLESTNQIANINFTDSDKDINENNQEASKNSQVQPPEVFVENQAPTTSPLHSNENSQAVGPYNEADKYGDQIEELKGLFEMQQREIEALKQAAPPTQGQDWIQKQQEPHQRQSHSSISEGERIQDQYTNDDHEHQERWSSRKGQFIQSLNRLQKEQSKTNSQSNEIVEIKDETSQKEYEEERSKSKSNSFKYADIADPKANVEMTPFNVSPRHEVTRGEIQDSQTLRTEVENIGAELQRHPSRDHLIESTEMKKGQFQQIKAKGEAQNSQWLKEQADKVEGDAILLRSLIQKDQSQELDQKSLAGSASKSPMNRFESKQEIREAVQKVSIDDKYFTDSQNKGILDQSKVGSIRSSRKIDKQREITKIESIMQDHNESDNESPINQIQQRSSNKMKTIDSRRSSHKSHHSAIKSHHSMHKSIVSVREDQQIMNKKSSTLKSSKSKTIDNELKITKTVSSGTKQTRNSQGSVHMKAQQDLRSQTHEKQLNSVQQDEQESRSTLPQRLSGTRQSILKSKQGSVDLERQITKELVGRSQEQVSPKNRTSNMGKSLSRKLRSSSKEQAIQSRSSVVGGRAKKSQHLNLNLQTSLEGAPEHIIMPTGSHGRNAVQNSFIKRESGGLNRSTVSNVRSNVPTEKVNGVHDTQSTYKVSAHEQKLTQSSQKPMQENVRIINDEKVSAGRTNESRERTRLQVTGNMSISADSQVQESNDEIFEEESPDVMDKPPLQMKNSIHPSQRSSTVIRDNQVGYSQTIVMKTLGAIQEGKAIESLGSIHSFKQVLDPTTSGSRSKTLVTQRASLPKVVSILSPRNSILQGSSQLPLGVQGSLEAKKKSIKISVDANQNYQRSDSSALMGPGLTETGQKAKGNIELIKQKYNYDRGIAKQVLNSSKKVSPIPQIGKQVTNKKMGSLGNQKLATKKSLIQKPNYPKPHGVSIVKDQMQGIRALSNKNQQKQSPMNRVNSQRSSNFESKGTFDNDRKGRKKSLNGLKIQNSKQKLHDSYIKHSEPPAESEFSKQLKLKKVSISDLMSKNIYMVKNEPKIMETPILPKSDYNSNPQKQNLINKIDWGQSQPDIVKPVRLIEDLVKKTEESNFQEKEETIQSSLERLESRSLSVINEAKSASGNASSAVDIQAKLTPSDRGSISSSAAIRRPEAIPSPLEPESLPRRDFGSVQKSKKINQSVNSKLLTSMNDNGFVIENDENIAYDKSSAHQQEESKILTLERITEKKEEQNKLTSVTYDSIETPGGVSNLEKQNTIRQSKKFPEPDLFKSITKSKEGFIFKDHRSLEEMSQQQSKNGAKWNSIQKNDVQDVKRSLQGEYLVQVAEAFSVEASKNFRSSHIYKLNNKGERVQNEDKQMIKNLQNVKTKNQAVDEYFSDLKQSKQIEMRETQNSKSFINRNRWQKQQNSSGHKNHYSQDNYTQMQMSPDEAALKIQSFVRMKLAQLHYMQQYEGIKLIQKQFYNYQNKKNTPKINLAVETPDLRTSLATFGAFQSSQAQLKDNHYQQNSKSKSQKGESSNNVSNSSDQGQVINIKLLLSPGMAGNNLKVRTIAQVQKSKKQKSPVNESIYPIPRLVSAIKRNHRNDKQIEEIENTDKSWFDDNKKANSTTSERESKPLSIKDHSKIKLPELNNVADKPTSLRSPTTVASQEQSSSPHRRQLDDEEANNDGANELWVWSIIKSTLRKQKWRLI